MKLLQQIKEIIMKKINFKFKKIKIFKNEFNTKVLNIKWIGLISLVVLVVVIGSVSLFYNSNAQTGGAGSGTTNHIKVNAKIGGVPTGVVQDNLDNLTQESQGVYTSAKTGIKITTPSVMKGRGAYPPYLSGGNGRGFGSNGADQPDGPDSTPFFQIKRYTNQPLILTLPGDQRYVGLLWGSVDKDNQLSFYKDGILIGSIYGQDISNDNDWASPGVNGTYYVNISSDTPFNKITFRGCTNNGCKHGSFEFDNLAFANYIPWDSTITKTSKVVDSTTRTAQPGDEIKYTIKYKIGSSIPPTSPVPPTSVCATNGLTNRTVWSSDSFNTTYTFCNGGTSAISPIVSGLISDSGYTHPSDCKGTLMNQPILSQGTYTSENTHPKLQCLLDPNKSGQVINWNVGLIDPGKFATFQLKIPLQIYMGGSHIFADSTIILNSWKSTNPTSSTPDITVGNKK